jgi:hypothetical protein
MDNNTSHQPEDDSLGGNTGRWIAWAVIGAATIGFFVYVALFHSA